MMQLLAVLLAANILAPSAILSAPAKFELQNVTVLGIVRAVAARPIPGGAITQFALCDSQCINVVEFSKPTVTVGQSVTVSGKFHQVFSNGVIQARNAVIVGQP